MPVRQTQKTNAFLIALALAASVFFAAALPASAFWSHSSSPRACAPHADRFDAGGLWLGHFSGGRRDHHANGDLRVDWRSEYQCFFSVKACQNWRAGMKREFAHYKGHGTCIALRGGGRPIRHVVHGISARY